MADKICGGFIVIARKIVESDIFTDGPPHYLKLFLWLLNKAFWKNGKSIQRGQVLTSISEMQDAGGHMVGYCRKRLTKDQVRSFYEAATKLQMITTMKTTRGFIITICNYDKYQNINNYEPHSEARKHPTSTPQPPHTIDETRYKQDIRIYKTIVEFLNSTAQTKYRWQTPKTQASINARVREGFTFEDFQTVINSKVAEWSGTDMQKFLRPDTLFGTKFESYLQAAGMAEPTKKKGYNFPAYCAKEACGDYRNPDPDKARQDIQCRTNCKRRPT